MTDLYELLGLDVYEPREGPITADDIKRAYHRISHHAHPDKGGSDEQFQPIKAAYDVLSDPERRAVYDETGSTEPPTDADKEIEDYLLQLFDTVIGQGHFQGNAGTERHPVSFSIVFLPFGIKPPPHMDSPGFFINLFNLGIFFFGKFRNNHPKIRRCYPDPFRSL